MTDPTVSAAREIFDEKIEGIHGSVDGLPTEALNWRPAGDDTNPIAVLAVHAMGSTRNWLAVAFGAQLPERDRSAEFRSVAGDGTELLAHVDRVAEDCRRLFDGAGRFQPDATRASGFRTRSGDEEVVTRAWAILHALEHLSEHVGHAQLTRQLWERREG